MARGRPVRPRLWLRIRSHDPRPLDVQLVEARLALRDAAWRRIAELVSRAAVDRQLGRMA